MNQQTSSRTALESITLGELAGRLGADLHGDPRTVISGVAGVESAGPGDISFVSNARYTSRARTTRAGALLVGIDFPALATPTLRLANPYLAFAETLGLFHPEPDFPEGIHPTAVVAASAHIGARAHIGAYVVVMEGASLGDDAVLLSHVVLYPRVVIGHRFFAHAHSVVREDCLLGDNVTLQNGAVIGPDGFGFARDAQLRWRKIPQIARAVLEDDVEVQANACVDRGSVEVTRVGRGSKIDNLVQVGHGSVIGADTLLCSQVGLAGSSHIGNRVILAGQVGVAGHCTVGDDVVATAQSGIPGDVAPGLTVSGYPAVENRRWLKSVALLNRLPDLFRNQKERQQ